MRERLILCALLLVAAVAVAAASRLERPSPSGTLVAIAPSHADAAVAWDDPSQAGGGRTPVRVLVDPVAAKQPVAPARSTPIAAAAIESAGEPAFAFHWESGEGSSPQARSHVNQPVVVRLGEELLELEHAAGDALLHEYGVVLDDAELAWDQEHAQVLLDTLRTIPRAQRPERPEHWLLASRALAGDFKISHAAGGRSVHVSAEVFAHAMPHSAWIDGRGGRLTSRRLQHVAVAVATDEGANLEAVEHILNERFAVSTVVPDYRALTRRTTKEGAGRFQSFRPEELLELIARFEELPPSLHRVEGLRYLLRRLEGTPHPFYAAPAVAWTRAGYIEFNDAAFVPANLESTRRLILHEKAHFVWSHGLPQGLQQDWIELGGWLQDPLDRNGWTSTDSMEFVTAYAHARGPEEDFAESVAFFVRNPDRLRSRSPRKYAFLRDQVMSGSTYLARIRPDMTFDVQDLDPDYVAPGMIRRVDVRVDGEPENEKLATIEIELFGRTEQELAQRARLRVSSAIGTYVDVRLRPVEGSPTVLRGTVQFSRYAKRGLWRTEQILLEDASGNQRFADSDDFGWMLFVDNPLEDVTKPRYSPGTLTLRVLPGHEPGVQIVRAQWQVKEEGRMSPHAPCHATLVSGDSKARRLAAYGTYDAARATCTVQWKLTTHHASGTYHLNHLSMKDAAGNSGGAYFTGQPGEERAPWVNVATGDPDAEPPEFDPEAFRVTARPTRAEAPDGETLVTIVYRVRDDKSGLGPVSYVLRDPQGTDHLAYHYHANFHTPRFEGDPGAWATHSIEALLPKGSAPGLWGLVSISATDKVGNTAFQDFVEILRFDVR